MTMIKTQTGVNRIAHRTFGESLYSTTATRVPFTKLIVNLSVNALINVFFCCRLPPPTTNTRSKTLSHARKRLMRGVSALLLFAKANTVLGTV